MAAFDVCCENEFAGLASDRPTCAETKHHFWPRVLCIGIPTALLLFGAASLSTPSVTAHPRQLSDTKDVPEPKLSSSGCCRFAKEFEGCDWHDPETQASFVTNAMHVESRFLGDATISFDADTGMTYDGVGLDYNTGDVQHGTIRPFSAPSKEALHLSILALVLQAPEELTAERAEALPALYSTEQALDILEKKVATMEDFDARYPGFGGYLTWFCSRGTNEHGSCTGPSEPAGKIAPLSGWERSLPGLDNGQLAFGAAAVAHVLQQRAAKEGPSSRFAQLAQRWNVRLQRMKDSAVNLFYDGAGLVRAIAELNDIKVDVAADKSNAQSINGQVLWDAFEGEMIVLFLDLFGNWSHFPDNGQADKDLIWRIKRDHVEPVVYTAADQTKMVLQKGFWFSAHEQWKILQVPYMDIPLVKHLFANGEYARLENSLQQNLPGLLASVNAPNGVQCDAHPYCSALGIQALAEQQIFTETVLTPYAAFPSILVDSAAGLAWYNHMLAMPRVQTPVGSIESFTETGKAVAPMATWDAKATTVLAMLGGTGGLIRNFMQNEGVYGTFETRVKSMYEPVFEPVINSTLQHGESIDARIANLRRFRCRTLILQHGREPFRRTFQPAAALTVRARQASCSPSTRESKCLEQLLCMF